MPGEVNGGTAGRLSPQVPIGEITTYPTFTCEVVDPEPGIREIVFTTIPHGKQMRFPFDTPSAEEFGKKLSAPTVEIAAEMPVDPLESR